MCDFTSPFGALYIYFRVQVLHIPITVLIQKNKLAKHNNNVQTTVGHLYY